MRGYLGLFGVEMFGSSMFSLYPSFAGQEQGTRVIVLSEKCWVRSNRAGTVCGQTHVSALNSNWTDSLQYVATIWHYLFCFEKFINRTFYSNSFFPLKNAREGKSNFQNIRKQTTLKSPFISFTACLNTGPNRASGNQDYVFFFSPLHVSLKSSQTTFGNRSQGRTPRNWRRIRRDASDQEVSVFRHGVCGVAL